MSTYALILAGTIFFPFILSFDKKVAFWKSWPRAALAALIIGIPFIIWDEIATLRGDWYFAQEHVWAFRLGGLPAEEILFFLIAPVACVFIHACIKAYIKPLPLRIKPAVFLIAAVICIILVFFACPRFYTATLLGACAVFFILCAVAGKKICADGRYWVSLGISFIPFLIVNGLLTGIPVVLYSPQAILGPRIFSIPIEDFMYSLVLIGGTNMIFDSLPLRFRRTKKPNSNA